MPDLRMDAYYYGFNETGEYAIDRILSAVACAGKSYHHTNCWNDDTAPRDGHEGNSPVEWIQMAAGKAAEEMTDLRARVRELELQLGLRDSCEMATTAVRLGVAPATAAVALEALTGGHVIRAAVADLRSIKSDLDSCRVEDGGAVVRDQK